jgi:beta-lactam-binding protein with PASTA domain
MDPSSNTIDRRERVEMALTIAAFAVVVAVVSISVLTSGAPSADVENATPEVVGMPLRHARAALRAEEQHISRIICASCEGSAIGCVVGQSIDPDGGPGGRPSAVLVVNSHLDGVLVPRVVGMSVDEAIRAVESAGLTVEIEPVLAFEGAPGDGAPGVVVEQEPPQRTVAPDESEVSLVLTQ